MLSSILEKQMTLSEGSETYDVGFRVEHTSVGRSFEFPAVYWRAFLLDVGISF